MPIATALNSLGGSLVLAKDGAGRVYWPAYHINQIGDMLPGQGYQVYLNTAGTLTYPANGLLMATEQKFAPLPVKHFTACAAGTGSNATLVIPSGTPKLELPVGVRLEIGDELAVFGAQSGLCAGALSWDGPTGAQALTVWGDDEITPAVDGLQPGEALTWKLWRRSSNEEVDITVTYRQEAPYQGDGTYADGGLYLLESLPQYQLYLPLLGR
jgi:hypothetical protein